MHLFLLHLTGISLRCQHQAHLVQPIVFVPSCLDEILNALRLCRFHLSCAWMSSQKWRNKSVGQEGKKKRKALNYTQNNKYTCNGYETCKTYCSLDCSCITHHLHHSPPQYRRVCFVFFFNIKNKHSSINSALTLGRARNQQSHLWTKQVQTLKKVTSR